MSNKFNDGIKALLVEFSIADMQRRTYERALEIIAENIGSRTVSEAIKSAENEIVEKFKNEQSS